MLHPSVLTTYWLGLLSICNDMPYPDITNDLPLELQTAAHYQECLGWGQVFHSHLTRHWAQVINHLHPYLVLSGKQIMTQFLQAVWTHILAIGTICNKHIHNDAGNLSLPNDQQAVRTLYERGAQLPPAAQEALFR